MIPTENLEVVRGRGTEREDGIRLWTRVMETSQRGRECVREVRDLSKFENSNILKINNNTSKLERTTKG